MKTVSVASALVLLSTCSLGLMMMMTATTGCGTKTIVEVPAQTAAEPTAPSTEEEGDAGGGGGVTEDPDAAITPAVCAPGLKLAKSSCKNENSWVRGTAHFDAGHYKDATKAPVLRLALRHAFALEAGEENIGGRLHAFASIPLTSADIDAGQISYAIDMCGLGTDMWSEDNGAFHLVLIIDEDGNNDLENAQTENEALVMSTPGMNELVKLVDVDISCHAPTACTDVTLDCTGPSCTKVTPMASCKAKLPGCNSGGGSFCTGAGDAG